MSKSNKRERIERATKFWDDKPPSKFLLSEQTVCLLDNSLQRLEAQKTLSIDHIHATVLSISLVEAQIRDCIRLRIDDYPIPANLEHPALRDELNIDVSLFASLRGHKFSLGEFIIINLNISTISHLISAMEFCFGSKEHQEIHLNSLIECGRMSDLSIKQFYASIAIAFDLRHRFVHELFDFTVSKIGSAVDAKAIFLAIRDIYQFLIWTQAFKRDLFSGDFPELETPRGETGKAINQANDRIQAKMEHINRFLETESDDPREQECLQGLKRNLKKAQRQHADFSQSAYEFIYYACGPGTMAIDAAYGRKLIDLENFERLLDRAIERKNIPV